MPQGKGTYGKQVGRPSKYQDGGSVPEPNFPQENPAISDANKMGQELKSIPLEKMEQEFPISNAMDRREVYQLGGMVKPPTSPSITPPPSYEKGGKVKK